MISEIGTPGVSQGAEWGGRLHAMKEVVKTYVAIL